jgi:hypothetical protein
MLQRKNRRAWSRISLCRRAADYRPWKAPPAFQALLILTMFPKA